MEETKTDAVAVREPTDIFARFDQLDDEAILAELEGRLTEVAVYHFNQQGKEIWGISKVGIDWATTELAKKGYILRDEKMDYQVDPTDPNYVLFTATVGKYFVAKDGAEAQGDAAIGNKRQSIKMQKRDGTTTPDPFWFEKGSQKAIRNARMRLIPEEIKSQIILMAKGQGRVKEVAPKVVAPTAMDDGPDPLADYAGPPTDDEKWGKVTLVMSDNKARQFGKFEAIPKFENMKAQIGKEHYYNILGEYGYEHSNEIKQRDMPKVWNALMDVYKTKQVTK